ncbi:MULTISPECIES: cellulose biosynthesis cyclic di-GMP-binding regulatory protein BcsB [Agrobacterium]|uniref:Cyclic di-GMP-binding protein n=1 Tax=Agrobacterium rosae TaxID=1972867 RepID=A0AAW9FEQ8_9HYPH|nr:MULTISPECIES: cellulose biosynthesis cyclic di-GMP-binding regulatory protein BcsB [Agrobacterium]MBN7806836.1 cellulose biosynthesis cyclic di-GMP-binding regulatory protein BcsB [Agrobacterium rosae]MDX8303990.1 cellulose biosynthesis cyclic di-GMP-binding regulatory protein BcsB [Agrobacterium rosae]MDX8314108.1 cellulose biosynthesis cyclic di-GMP-binding regulatory protein BcsB [Agrobacterium rosae]POO55206.1 cellulose synthase BcsB subunit [Agrobacterium rosae]SCX11855.1 cellulose syn
MRKALLLTAFLASVSTVAFAQSTPFDMSPERPAAAPQPIRPPPVASPLPQTQPPARVAPGAPGASAPLNASPAVVTRLAAGSPDDRRRYILPFSDLSLSGETDQRQWTLHLTQDQAKSAVSLNIGYQNAIVVAPESSNLEVSVNNVPLERKSVSSPDAEGNVTMTIPPGALQAGANIVSLGVQQRHRTDCTIQSTYDLWTEVSPASTYISFNSDVGGRFDTIDDIQATGADPTGLTSIEIVAPGLANPVSAPPLLRLAQAIALRTQMPNQNVTFSTALPTERKAGTLVVIAGTSREIATATRSVPPEALAGPYAGFENNVVPGVSALIVSGPTSQAVQTAIESLSSSVERPVGTSRTALSTKAWHTPDAPLVMSDRRLPLSALGVRSSEFSGRRFRTEFTIGAPADFYASAYGEATLLLDAAYSNEILPGSHIDVYVNGNIASTVPVSNRGGGIFRHLPINVTMRHFVPGVNTIAIEAVLVTEADNACLPGAPANQTPRFALFDTSELHIPNYAMIGRAPDLAAMNGVGQPYREGGQPVAVWLERVDVDTMSAAATLLSRLALAGGHPVPVELVATPAAVGDRNALFFGTLAQMPQGLVTQLDLASASQVAWKESENAVQPAQTDQLFDDWRERVDGGVWQGQVSSFEEWLKRNFDISSDTLRFLPGAEQVYTPPGNVTFMLAQGMSPGGEGVWTMATAPTSEDLRTGMAAIVEQKRWSALAGRVATYDATSDKVETIAAEQPAFIVTRPFSFSNWRLIAANWLSTNTLSYSLVFIGFLTLLGCVTFLMLRGMGRDK